MESYVKRLRIPAISLLLAALVLVPSHVTLNAGNPTGAYYSAATDKVFWFIHASDLHVGTSGSADTSNLQWLVTTAREVIAPSFIVVTGDLTDSTNGNFLGYPNGPYQAEWDQYKSLLSSAGVDANFYYDIPGNHDAYNDRYFAYYLANSIQGRATGKTQVSWTRTFPFGTYHFLGVNSADNTGDGFSLSWPYGDHAGLDVDELAFINGELTTHSDASLTLVFGHHPIIDTGDSSDTWLFYGQQQLIQALDGHRASTYNYGHTHRNSQALFTGIGTATMPNGGVHYYNVAALGKNSPNSISLVAIDCNGVSSVTRPIRTWPVVLISAPVSKYVGTEVNPYVYPVTASANNPIRALVFDTGSISVVQFRIDGGGWHLMSRVAGNPDLWNGTWDASTLAPGNHTIEVQATGSSTTSHTISVEVTAGVPNQAPTAVGETYTTAYQTARVVPAPGVLGNDSDPEGTVLTASLVTGPTHGSVTLSGNGSFTYTPAASFSGADSFTYRAFDGALYSAPATVAITVTAAPTTDTVTITSAAYNARKKQLSVTATSSAQPNATLNVVGYGQMTYKPKSKAYVLTTGVSEKPSGVTVTSSLGGSAYRPVS